MAVLLASMKVAVLEHLLDFRSSSIPASGRKLAKLMMNFRSLSFLAIFILLIVPVESFRGKLFFSAHKEKKHCFDIFVTDVLLV